MPTPTRPGSEGGRDESGEVVATIAPHAEVRSALKLADAAFHGPAGELVRLIEPHSEADPTALLVNALAALGNLIGPTPYMRVEGDRHPARLCAVLVGETAKARKGTSWGRIRSILEHVDDRWARERVKSGLISGEGLIDHVRDSREGEDPLDRRLFLVEGEFASLLRVMERAGNTLSPTIRNLWDSGNAQTLAKNAPTKTTGAHVSIVGHVTQDELLRYLTATEQANGFGNRFLWFKVDRSKVLPFGGDLEQENLSPIVDRLRAAVSKARRIGRVRWSPEAARLWAENYEDLSAGRPGMIGAMTARFEAQAIRLALTYAVLDGSDKILVDHLDAAYKILDASYESVAQIFAYRTGDPLADRIGDLLRTAPDQTSTRTELRDATGRNYDAGRMDAAIGQLKGLDLVLEEQQDTDGRPATVYQWIGPTGKAG